MMGTRTFGARLWLLLLLGLMLPSSALLAQEEGAEETGEASEDSDADAEEEEAGEDAPQSSHGTYEWKFAYGGGVEVGLFITPFDRWNTHILEPNSRQPIDVDLMVDYPITVEVYPFEGFRIAAFFGIGTIFDATHSMLALYGGLEPAIAVRRGMIEFSVGSGIGGGLASFETGGGETLDATLLVIRPFLEFRVYPTDFMAVYTRLGFNFWDVQETEGSEAIQPRDPAGFDTTPDQINENGPYVAVGVRFGQYPDPVKVVEDSDGDGLRDDVDDCPAEPEDEDGFEDTDGCPDTDNDEDGILDDVDACVDEPEDLDGWKDEDGCPEDDDDVDGDGLFGEADACPEQAEDIDGWKDEDGCPEDDDDLDGDGVLGKADLCPNDKEDMDNFNDTDGCPDFDNDIDGFCDPWVATSGMKVTVCQGIDKCPDEKEVINGVEDEDGCPDEGKTLVTITVEKIEILEKVFFATGKARIRKQSYNLLDQVAIAVKSNPGIVKVRIEGHTDSSGDPEKNKKLSQDRANAVRDYLIGKGVEAERLEAVGFGQDQPIDTNDTDEGKANNRRVEFKILEFATK